ncbi:Metallo-dependent phosphatase [Dacryopinax primogenitus]|uniref:Metallo-dependent phosphatase n=1 Tax=Dacryopinax primogenitus (strain DJM 731) TaxID=1858805 RepID=M5GFY8_DACPD|nr:Metallo-dependent phosphatase [Dacryopinax primogenitus]EJU04568.1 Metallo-dependent phosphatase [Dacryopinax primogenitus]
MSTRQFAYGAVAALCILSLTWYTLKPGAEWTKSVSFADGEVVLDPSGIDFSGKVDFGKYRYRDIIPVEELHLEDPTRRVIIVGDIHGMWKPFQELMNKVDYNSEKDILFHVGDVIAKGTDSDKVLKWLIDHNIRGVRGNHDQKVIGWRIWQDWVEAVPGGKQWLKRVEKFTHSEFTSQQVKHKESKADKMHRKQFAFPDDRDWVWSSEHYGIARKLTHEQYEYLLNLPLTISFPGMKTHLVHAGILPHQLKEEKPDPWSLLNMRSVLSSGAVSRKFDGTPWTELFNHYQQSGEDAKKEDREAVVFGHAAKLGLQVERWTLGLDTGCVYGRELTAVVINGGDVDAVDVNDTGHGRKVHVGNTTGRLWNVDCKAP